MNSEVQTIRLSLDNYLSFLETGLKSMHLIDNDAVVTGTERSAFDSQIIIHIKKEVLN